MFENIILTNLDNEAILNGDSGVINNKGATFYKEGEYEKAAFYYHLASSMGNMQATSNLGYCYLYGRHTEINIDLAIAYFKISAKAGIVDSAYKLGDIYSKDRWVEKDKELSNYYYELAVKYIVGDDYYGNNTILYQDDLIHYPSLCFAMGREMSPDGGLFTDIRTAYQFLLWAKKGYKLELDNGQTMYEESYNNVKELMKSEIYNDVRKELEDLFYDYDEDDDDNYDE